MQTISVLLKRKIVNRRKVIILTVCFFCILVTLVTTEHSRVSYVYLCTHIHWKERLKNYMRKKITEIPGLKAIKHSAHVHLARAMQFLVSRNRCYL